MIVEWYEDVIVLSGALRQNFWETIHTTVSLLLKGHPSGVIIDCLGITECSPEGAETFIDVMNFIEEHDARIIVARVPQHLMDVLKSVPEVRSQLPIANTVEEARRSLDLLSETEEDRKKRRPTAIPASRMILLVTGGPYDKAGAFAAIRMAEIMRAQVLLTYIIIVPRELPEQAPLPEKEERAVQAIEEVRTLFEADSIHTTPVVKRGRDVGTALNEVCEESEAMTLVVALSSETEDIDDEMKLVRSVMLKVRASVMVVRPPMA